MAIVSDRKITYEKKISQIEKQMEVGTLTVIIKTVFLLSQTVNIIWDEFVKLLQWNIAAKFIVPCNITYQMSLHPQQRIVFKLVNY